LINISEFNDSICGALRRKRFRYRRSAHGVDGTLRVLRFYFGMHKVVGCYGADSTMHDGKFDSVFLLDQFDGIEDGIELRARFSLDYQRYDRS
jgi:hypothetical protein